MIILFSVKCSVSHFTLSGLAPEGSYVRSFRCGAYIQLSQFPGQLTVWMNMFS